MVGVIILAPQTDDRKSRPKGYSPTTPKEKKGGAFDGGNLADYTRAQRKREGGEKQVCMLLLPMFT